MGGRSVAAFNEDGSRWDGYGNDYNANLNGYGTGSRPAPATNGNREPTGNYGVGGGYGGYYRGIDMSSPQSGAAGNSSNALRLIPSPQGAQGNGPGRGEIPEANRGI